MEEKKYPFGVIFIDGKAQLPKNAKFGGIMYFCKESDTASGTNSWLKEYKSYIEDFVINDLFDDELMSFSIIFKFPNGYGAEVKFESDNTKTLDDYYVHAIDISVEMLDKDGEKFTADSDEKKRISEFLDRYCNRRVISYEVEDFLEAVMHI